MNQRRVRLCIASFFIALTISLAVFNVSFTATSHFYFLCPRHLVGGGGHQVSATPMQLNTVLHYATSEDIPQQSKQEIQVTFGILRSLSHASNFLVFGLGHDSLMWSAFNPNGLTFFLEENSGWVQTVLTKAPTLRVHSVNYHTRLYDAKNLLDRYRLEPTCLPPKLHLRGNTRCRLVLSGLPDEAYNRNWDVITIDGPKGYNAEAPGRMSAIFTAAMMAKSGAEPGVTHVVLHDVNRRVEKVYAERFLCRKYLVHTVEKLWHFVIPPATKDQKESGRGYFCQGNKLARFRSFSTLKMKDTKR